MKNILWVPLDLPPIEKEITLANIKNLFDYVPNASQEERKILAEQKQHYKYAWNTFRLRYPGEQKVDWAGQNLNQNWEWTENAREHCPKLISYIEQYLPFSNLKAVSIMSSTGLVPLHLDMPLSAPDHEKQNYIENEPSIFRLLLDGSIREKSFYVASRSTGKQYVTLPTDSPGWAMGCYSCGHGNDQIEPHQKLLVYLMGDLDKNKHTELISRSFNKFKNYTVLSTEQI